MRSDTNGGAGRKFGADKARSTASASSPTEDAGQRAIADKALGAAPASSPLAERCAAIRYHHRQRVYAMEQRKRADLALGSFLRMVLGWSLSLPASEREAIRAKAASLQDIGDKISRGRPVEGADDPLFVEWSGLILASMQARAPFDKIEAEALKQMKAIAKQLPVWGEWAESIRGFGEASLAVIAAEAGDLSVYPKKGHLWKRMGLAVMDGVRQGGLAKSAPKDDWIAHGYNRQRRSRMWNIGDALVKSQGPYREVYLARKEYERAQAEARGLIVAPSAKIPAKRQSEFISDGHIHRRAQRYMEKRLLRDLWQAWNGRRAIENAPEKAERELPADHPIEREAIQRGPLQASLQVPPAQPPDREAIEQSPSQAIFSVPPGQPIEREATARGPLQAIEHVPLAQPFHGERRAAGHALEAAEAHHALPADPSLGVSA